MSFSLQKKIIIVFVCVDKVKSIHILFDKQDNAVK